MSRHGLVHVDLLLGQQCRHHLHVSPLTRDEKRRPAPLPGVVHGVARAIAIEQGRHGAGVAPLAGAPEARSRDLDYLYFAIVCVTRVCV